MPQITSCSVKVMRSFDYCHFEINLTASSTPIPSGASFDDAISLLDVDALRKEAARLADKAVEQYKAMKRAIQKAENAGYDRASLAVDAERVRAISETDRTPEQKAVLKAYEDSCFQANRRYDYEDDWQDPDDE